jgi:hypothetical protein
VVARDVAVAVAVAGCIFLVSTLTYQIFFVLVVVTIIIILTWRNRRLPSPTRINLEEP